MLLTVMLPVQVLTRIIYWRKLIGILSLLEGQHFW